MLIQEEGYLCQMMNWIPVCYLFIAFINYTLLKVVDKQSIIKQVVLMTCPTQELYSWISRARWILCCLYLRSNGNIWVMFPYPLQTPLYPGCSSSFRCILVSVLVEVLCLLLDSHTVNIGLVLIYLTSVEMLVAQTNKQTSQHNAVSLICTV